MQYYSHRYQLMSKGLPGEYADKTCMQRGSRYQGPLVRPVCCRRGVACSKTRLEARKKAPQKKKKDEVGADHIGPCIFHLASVVWTLLFAVPPASVRTVASKEQYFYIHPAVRVSCQSDQCRELVVAVVCTHKPSTMNPSKCCMARRARRWLSGSYPAFWPDLCLGSRPQRLSGGSAFAAAGAAFLRSGRVPVPAALCVSSTGELQENKALAGIESRCGFCVLQSCLDLTLS